MTGYQELHALAQHQLIAHALAVTVTSIHQDLQQIMTGRLLASPLDVLEQDSIGAGPHLVVPAQFAGDFKPRIEVGLNGLTNQKFLNGRDGLADEVDVFVLQVGAKKRSAYHLESNLHQLGIDIDGAHTSLPVEIPQ